MVWSWDRWLDELDAATQRTRLDQVEDFGQVENSEPLEMSQIVLEQPPISWTLRIADGQITLLRKATDSADVTLRCDPDTARGLALGTITPAGALAQGRLKMSGKPATLLKGLNTLLAIQSELAKSMPS